MKKALSESVVKACAKALATGDVVPLHQAQEAIEAYVLRHHARGDAARLLEHERLRDVGPHQRLVDLSFKAIGGRR